MNRQMHSIKYNKIQIENRIYDGYQIPAPIVYIHTTGMTHFRIYVHVRVRMYINEMTVQ